MKEVVGDKETTNKFRKTPSSFLRVKIISKHFLFIEEAPI